MTVQTTKKRLGRVEFADWFDSPEFEIDADERMEERATSAKGPIRLAASALLRLDARTARLRASFEEPPATSVDFTPAPAPVPASRRRTKLGAVDEVAWKSWSKGAEDNGLDQALEELDQDRRPASRGLSRMRQKFAGALDRWAEREADFGMRLDRALFPWTRES